jgi:MoxR-like ATPase
MVDRRNELTAAAAPTDLHVHGGTSTATLWRCQLPCLQAAPAGTVCGPVGQTTAPTVEDDANPVHETARRLLGNVERVVVGKHDEISLVLAALVSGGHVLLEDVPGTAKTILARAIAQSIDGASFARIQCTPDLQPTDVTGLSIFDQQTRAFEFRPGPIFATIVLVDEVNRAMPRTQSALLEAMAERQVTVDGVTRPLPEPFLVIATENPIEHEGTFPLPEAQLDRFTLRSGLGYPRRDDEVAIVLAQRHGHPIAGLEPVVSAEEVLALEGAVEDVYVDELLLDWIVDLVRATRAAEGVWTGASVRGSLMLERTARAWALLQGRDHVVPADVERLFLPVLGHRLLLTASFLADLDGAGRDEALVRVKERCLELAPPPAPDWDR